MARTTILGNRKPARKTKAQLLAEIESLRTFMRLPILSITARQEMLMRESAGFIAAEQYGSGIPLPGEIGCYKGQRLFSRIEPFVRS